MAGHRQRTGRPQRWQAMGYRAAERLAMAQAPDERLAAAYDRFRLAMAHLTKGGGGTEAARMTHDLATHIARVTPATGRRQT